MNGASERANGRASGPVLQSLFLTVIDHSEHVLFFPSYDMRVFHCRFRDLTPIGLVWTFPLPRRTFTSEQVYVKIKCACIFFLLFDNFVFSRHSLDGTLTSS